MLYRNMQDVHARCALFRQQRMDFHKLPEQPCARGHQLSSASLRAEVQPGIAYAWHKHCQAV